MENEKENEKNNFNNYNIEKDECKFNNKIEEFKDYFFFSISFSI